MAASSSSWRRRRPQQHTTTLLLLVAAGLLAAVGQAWIVGTPPASPSQLDRSSRRTAAAAPAPAPASCALDRFVIAGAAGRGKLELLRRWAAEEDSEDGGGEEEAGDEAEPLESMLKGKQRRALRALAGRKKNDKSLFTMQQKEEAPSESFLKEVASALRAHELVNVRVLFAQKKKEAKAVGTVMARSASAELVQVIGHTYLLYKPADPPKINLAALAAPAEGA